MSMLKQIASAFFADFHWKLLSLLIAFVLWFVSANVNNPSVNHQFHVLLNLQNVELLNRDQIVLLNEDALRETMIQIVIRGQRREIEALAARDPYFISTMITPSIDLRAIDPSKVLHADYPITVPLDVTVNLYPAFEHFSIRPGYVEVQLDALVSERFMVGTDIVGEISPGFELRNIHLVNNHVSVTGARNDVKDVASVGVQVDILGVHTVTEQIVTLTVFDHDGYDMTDRVQLSVTETTATIHVWPDNAVEILLETVGEVAPGFAVANIYFEPETVNVVALPERLEALDYIVVEIDLNHANTDFAHAIDLVPWLPDGVHLRRDTETAVGVYVTVEPIESRFFNVPRDNVRIRGFEAIYQILGDNLPIQVGASGPRSLINALEYHQIELELDLRNLYIGIHDIPLTVGLPEGLDLFATRPVLQVQIHEPAPEVSYEEAEYDEATTETDI